MSSMSFVEDSNEDELIRSPLFNFRAREWPLVKNPRKRICVSIYIPDRHRPLLRGDEFNRRIPFTLVKSPGIGTTLSSFLSNISRGIFYNFSNNNKFRSSFPFLLLFSFLSPFVFSFFTHTVAPRAPFHFAFASRTIPHSKYRSRPFSTDPRSPLATYSSLLSPSPHLRTSPRYKRMHARVSCSFEQRGESVASDLQPSAIRVRSVQQIKLSPLHRMYK